MELDIHLCEQTASDDLPDETKYEVLSAFSEICCANIYNGTSNAFGGGDNNVVVFRDLEGIEWFTWLRLIQHPHVDSIRYRIINEFAKDQTILAFIEELHGVCRDWMAMSYIWIVFDDLYTMLA